MALPNPREVAASYMEKHKVSQMFEELATLVYHAQPENPREFVLLKLEEMKAAKESGKPVEFFSPADCDAMFSMFDVTGKGHITVSQYQQALKNFGITQSKVALPENVKTVDKKMFLTTVQQEIQHNLSTA